MPGSLDPKSPTVEAEYARFIDGDVLGKLVFKNFVVNRSRWIQDPDVGPGKGVACDWPAYEGRGAGVSAALGARQS
jgi:hypothetical protein